MAYCKPKPIVGEIKLLVGSLICGELLHSCKVQGMAQKAEELMLPMFPMSRFQSEPPFGLYDLLPNSGLGLAAGPKQADV